MNYRQLRVPSGVLRFISHFLQMTIAMAIGMLVLDPVWRAILPGLNKQADVQAVVAATDMAIGMVAWMRFHRHSWASTLEMSAAMYLPFLVLLVPYWAGGITGTTLMMFGHVLMVPAMLAVMLRRRAEYTHPRGQAHSPRLRRWTRALVSATAVLVAFAALPATIGTVRAVSYLDSIYAPPSDTAVPASVRDARPVHDPTKRTAVVLVSNAGANVGDTLAPYETLAVTGAYNLYIVAPERRLVTLTGRLDLVPDLSLAELDQRLGGHAPDVIAVPALPDATESTSTSLRSWLSRKAAEGALVLGICQGAEVTAAAGVLDGHDSTSHWFRVDGLERRYPQVRWHRATRYLDDGNMITTGGVLSGIDGTLRVIERQLGTQAASAAATAVGWAHYSPNTPAPLPRSTFGLFDMVTGVNLSFRSHPTIGVLLTDGIGEIELASPYITYSDVSYAARTASLAAESAAPVRTRHGLTFVPRGSALDASNLDRLVVPGVDAARRNDPALHTRVQVATGLTPEYLHREPGFPFDAVLRDMARTIDVPTAHWRGKTLEYPTDGLNLTGPGWPWGATLLPLLYGLIGLGAATAVRLALRARRARRAAAIETSRLDGLGVPPTSTASGVDQALVAAER